MKNRKIRFEAAVKSRTMSLLAFAALVLVLFCGIALADGVTVYRLELHDNGGVETPLIVGADGIKRPVVLISPDEYAHLTNDVCAVLRAMNSTEDGRRKLHGAKKGTTVTQDEVITEYADGFRYTEKPVKRNSAPRVVTGNKRNPTPPSPKVRKDDGRHSARQLEMRKRLQERKEGKVRQVTVEHDALTGKDKVVE